MIRVEVNSVSSDKSRKRVCQDQFQSVLKSNRDDFYFFLCHYNLLHYCHWMIFFFFLILVYFVILVIYMTVYNWLIIWILIWRLMKKKVLGCIFEDELCRKSPPPLPLFKKSCLLSVVVNIKSWHLSGGRRERKKKKNYITTISLGFIIWIYPPPPTSLFLSMYASLQISVFFIIFFSLYLVRVDVCVCGGGE